MKMSNKTYDILKFIALLILPVSELISALASVWGIPYGAEIVATLVAVDVFMGALVKIAADGYNKGQEADDNVE